MNEQECILGAPSVVGSLAKRSEQHRRGKLAVTQQPARLVELLQRLERDQERDDQYQRDREQAPAEASAQCHLCGDSLTIFDSPDER